MAWEHASGVVPQQGLAMASGAYRRADGVPPPERIGGGPGAAPPATLDDAALLARIAGGDVAAFETFFRRHHRRLFRFLLVLTSRPDVAEELANETMLAVWRGAGSFRGEARASSWLYGIAVRRAGKRRSRRQLPLEPLEAHAETLADPAAGVAVVEQARLRQQLPGLLARLPAVQRVAIELTYLYGHSLHEIAVITGVPVGTVKTRLFYARASLRAMAGADPPPQAGKDRPWP